MNEFQKRQNRRQWWIGFSALVCCICIVLVIMIGAYLMWFESDMPVSVKILCTTMAFGLMSFATMKTLEADGWSKIF